MSSRAASSLVTHKRPLGCHSPHDPTITDFSKKCARTGLLSVAWPSAQGGAPPGLPFFHRSPFLTRRPGFLERPGRRQPADRYVEAPSHVCLRFAISKALHGFAPLMRCQSRRPPESRQGLCSRSRRLLSWRVPCPGVVAGPSVAVTNLVAVDEFKGKAGVGDHFVRYQDDVAPFPIAGFVSRGSHKGAPELTRKAVFGHRSMTSRCVSTRVTVSLPLYG